MKGKQQGRRKPSVFIPLCSCSGESQRDMWVLAAVERKGKQAASGASEEEESIQEDVALREAWQVPRSVPCWFGDSSGTLISTPHRLKASRRCQSTGASPSNAHYGASVGNERWPCSSILPEHLHQETGSLTELSPHMCVGVYVGGGENQ